MSIKLKLAILFLAVALIPTLLVVAISFQNYRHSLQASSIAALRHLTSYKADTIETYFDGLKTNIKVAQGFYNVKKNLPVITRFAQDPDNPEFIAAKKMLDGQLQQMWAALSLHDIMLLDPQGEIVYSANPAHYSIDFLQSLPDPDQQAFEKGKKDIYFADVFFNAQKDNRLEMLVTAPVTGFNDAFIGVMAFEIDMAPIYKLIQDTTGLGKTGETLVGRKTDTHVEFLNPLRHDLEAALKRKITLGDLVAYPIQQAVQGKTGAGISVDYRGKKVIAAWRYIPSLDWGLVAKIDQHEAFADVANLQKLVAIILLLILMLAALMAFSIARSIAEPVRKLAEGAAIIGSGDLDFKVATDAKDEIGRLSRSFDKMTHDLKETTASRDELNREIARRMRTEEELRTSHTNLETQNIELRKAQEALRESKTDLSRAQAVALVGSWRMNVQKNELTWSDEAYRIFGIPRGTALTYESFLAAVYPDDRTYVDQKWNAALAGEPYNIEHQIVVGGQIKWVREKAELEFDKDDNLLGGFGTVQDITERKSSQQERETTIEFLRIVNGSTSSRQLIRAAAAFFQQQSGCEAVGIRLKEGDDYPYFEARGFPKEFVQAGNSLCSRDSAGNIIRDSKGYPIQECMCGNVIQGRFDPSKPFFTKRGSFWTNCTTELLATTTEADRQARTRNCCHGQDYESVILIGLRVGEECLGLLQLNDRRKNQFTPETINLWERLADHLAVAAAKFRAEESLQKSEERYRRLFEDDLTGDFIADKNGKILMCNPAFARIYGFTSCEEAIGSNLTDMHINPDGWIDFNKLIKQRKVLERYECHRKRRDGTIIYIVENVIGTFDDNGELAQLKGYIFDDTERKKAEEALQQTKNELELRVKERTVQLTHTVETLEDEVRHRLAAQKDLKQSEERYRSLTVATTQIVWTTSPNGEVVGDLPSWREFTGQTIDEIEGWGWINALHPDDRDRTAAIWSEAVRTCSLYQNEYRIRRHDGQYRYFAVRGVPVLEEDGCTIREWIGTCTDINERKVAQQRQAVTNALLELFARKESQKQYLDSTVEAIHQWSDCEFVGIRIKDKEGNIPYESHVGFDKDFLKLENNLNLSSDHCVCIRSILQEPQQQEKSFMTDAGSFYCNDSLAFVNGLTEKQKKEYRATCVKKGFLSIAVVPVRYHNEIYGAIHLADLKKDMVLLPKIQFIESTIAPLIGEAIQRFNAEAEVEKYRLHLEELVAKRTQELEKEVAHRKLIAEDLARSNKDLEQFAYVASHDLQEPLRAVAGFVELLKIKLDKTLDNKGSEYMTHTVEGVKRMQDLINGLLEYSRIGTRGKKPEPVDSKTALDHALAHLHMSISESGAKITAGQLPKVNFDSFQLAQLFQNLISNAIKFHSERAPEISITANHQDGFWQFAVADNGIGIEPQYADRIFLIFQRLHSRVKYPGTGIGLALCKKIVERHGGKIWVESKAGAGSTFYFTIPDIGESS